MTSFVPKALLLLLLANLTLTRYPEGFHSMRFLHTLLTWPGLLEPHFIIVGLVGDIEFERFDSREEPLRLQHCAPWVDQQEPWYWEQKTRNLLILMDYYSGIMEKMLRFYDQGESGNHTIQSLFACDILPGVYFSRGVYGFVLDGHDYLALNEDLSTWTAVGKAAEMLKQEWKASGFANSIKNALEYHCVSSLFNQLDYGKEILMRTDTPKMHVTRKVRADGKITLRCLALNFYPADITLTWQKDGSNQTLDTEVMDTRPAGDGSFQKWAAVVVPSGEEQRYTCHVDHEGLPEPLTLRWEPPQPSVPIMPIVTGLVLGAALMGAVVTFLIWRRKTKG